MSVLVLNSGSSSLKYALYHNESVVYEGLIEHIGEAKSPIQSHSQALELVFETLEHEKYLNSIDALSCVGHRVVHGGNYFSKSVVIDDEVIAKIEAAIPLAPLHNRANLEGIKAINKHAPDVKQVAVFDTAFHQSMPQTSFLYAIDYELYEKEHIRRYGFHGTSHAYVVKSAALFLNHERDRFNAISLHLGNGASICAVKAGKSVDTSMGFSPLEGLMMGTRSGDIDPQVILYLQERLGMSTEDISTLLNKKSGLQGIANDNDMRHILERKAQGDDMARVAFEMFVYRIRKYIGSYALVLGRIDAIIFTGGIGENAPAIRSAVLEGTKDLLGWELDLEKNSNIDADVVLINSSESTTKICVIRTDEALEIVRECHQLLRL